MNLIDIYIQEVTRRLPEKDREDVSMELRSTIEDMLPDDYGEDEAKEALAKLGNPAVLASGYSNRPMHLIGPHYYESYVSLLKMLLPIAIVISVISVVAENLIGYSGGENPDTMIHAFVNLIVEGIVGSFGVIVQFFFWITVIFVIIERADANRDSESNASRFKAWTPDDLKKLAHIPEKRVISKISVFGSLLWTTVWVSLYFYADHIVVVHLRQDSGLELLYSVFNQEVLLRYWPLVLIMAGLEIALALYKYFIGQWTPRLAIFNTVVQLMGALIVIFILLSPNLFNPDFLAFMADLFAVTVEKFKSGVIAGSIALWMISVILSMIEGFRKAKIQ